MSQPNTLKKRITFSIFIADSNEINCLLLQSQLEIHDRNITTSSDGQEAQRYLLNNQYDLILLSLELSSLSSLELLNHIKKTDSMNKDSPIIALTEETQTNERMALIHAGFDECLVQPILLEQLTEVLSIWLPTAYIENETIQQENLYVSALLKKTMGNKEQANTIANKLFSELPQQIQIIENALLANDLSLALQITHKLHGSISFCGFIDIKPEANELEKSLIKKHRKSIKTHFQGLQKKINDFMGLRYNILDELNKI